MYNESAWAGPPLTKSNRPVVFLQTEFREPGSHSRVKKRMNYSLRPGDLGQTLVSSTIVKGML